MPNNARNIVIYAIFACAILYYIEQYTTISYLYKTLFKILFFEGGALLLLRGKAKTKAKKSLKLATILSTVVFFVILVAYYFLGHLIDSEQIVRSLNERSITAATLGWIFTYITLGNSFLEESFFRGMVFLGLRGWNKKFAYIFSAGLFSLYHIGIFLTWFTPLIIMISLAGLFLGGILFAWIADRSDSFIGSWIFHIGADLAIVLIGLRMFGVI